MKMSQIFDQDSEYLYAIFENEDEKVLVEVFPDGQMHIAFKNGTDQCWSKGFWTIYRRAQMQ